VSVLRRQRPEDVGREPDYRFTLANERTYLAWIRTALALNVAGLGIVQFLDVPGGGWTSEALGLLLAALGLVLALTSLRRYRENQRAIRTDQPLPPTGIPTVVGVGLALASALAIVLVLTGSS
jgi:putative membrane protein